MLELIDLCEPTAAELGEAEGLQIAREIVTGLAGYRHQRQVYAQVHSARAVVEQLTVTINGLEGIKKPPHLTNS